MADEDLFSLDFTLPEAPESAPAPVTGTPPAPPQPPLELPRLALELVDVDAPLPLPVAEPVAEPLTESSAESFTAPAPAAPAFPDALCDAAALHAAGDYINASRRLDAALKAGGQPPAATDLIWRSLFEVLQDLDRHDAFDKLAMAYARHFEVSPPTWVAGARESTEPDQDDVSRFALPEVLDATVGPALKQLMQLARAHRVLHIDLRAVREADEPGCTLLLRAFKALDAAGRDYDLDGAEHLAGLLDGKVELMVREHESIWMLLLELYAGIGQQEAFEDTAVNYAVTFEVSPPSWEARPSRLAVTRPLDTAAAAGSSPLPLLTGELNSPIIALPVADGSEPILDAATLQRIDQAAAASLLAALTPATTEKAATATRWTIANLPPLPYVFLHQQGLAAVASLTLRKA